MNIQDLQKQIWEIAESKGWHTETDTVPVKLLMIHTEVSEATDDFRNKKEILYWDDDGKPCGLGIELADALIRILDLAEMLGFDMGSMIDIKMKYNEGRSQRHGGKLI